MTAPVDPSNAVLGAPTPAATTPAAGSVPSSASDMLRDTLTQWGLASLIPNITQYINQGYDSTTINLALQNTPEWKTRFAGNEIRKAQGLPVLTPAQYIATEEQYSNVLRSYGLPAGFYDSHDDFNDLIGKDVSPAELQTRAQVAHDQYMNAPPEMKQLWQSYGFAQGDMIAGILDPNVATQTIQDRATQVAIGGTAAQNGFQLSQGRAQAMQQHGVTLAQAQAAYKKIGQNMPTDQAIASRFGQQFGQTQEENDYLLDVGAAAQQRASLYGQENALFGGHSGTNTAGIGVSQQH